LIAVIDRRADIVCTETSFARASPDEASWLAKC
jgi:hypothetical protein